MSTRSEEEERKPTWKERVIHVIASTSVEPVMLLDGLAFSNMVVLVENLQMDKICHITLNHTAEVCANISQYPDVRKAQQQEVSIFSMYNAIIMSVIPLFFILFMGAWSDKYGRKVPLCAAMLGHTMYSAGYLLNSWVWHWPVEYLLVVGLLESLGGGAVSFLTAANSYISDVTTEESRTSRVGLANSIWFLGGPIGTLMGTYIYRAAGYQVLFGTSLLMHIIATLYIIFLLPESHGPFADKKRLSKVLAPKPTYKLRHSIIQVYGLSRRKKNTESEVQRALDEITVKKMILDFFNPQRFIDSFRSTLRKREGNVRIYILLLIAANLLRKIGRGAYMYLFTRTVLDWGPADYGVWVTYKNIVATVGSLVAVPVLSAGLQVSDSVLAMVGALSSVLDYVLYGLVSPSAQFLIWLAPISAMLVNSGAIAIRALLSKYVAPDELGKVSAVLGALDGVMPMLSFSLYTAVYHSTVAVFPGAQFYFGAAVNCLMAFIFAFIILSDKTKQYDVETAKIAPPTGPVVEKNLVVHTDSNWLYDDYNNYKMRISTILLSAINFSIEVPLMERTLSRKSNLVNKRPERTKPMNIIGEGSRENSEERDVPENVEARKERSVNGKVGWSVSVESKENAKRQKSDEGISKDISEEENFESNEEKGDNDGTVNKAYESD
ncbi:proton-coupled folate transporter [Hyalella azteca]|uniref:Proton-coupled folate transporter n=1 Tax=Hyalella azteca TaxID=294128 RepID=A0A8B7N9N8_HYAAZ|nr:proton-coupled folate transporter [Hyalella azteca]